MHSGASLVHDLPGRIGLELRMVVQGGLRILDRLERVNFDVYHARPVLGRADWLAMAFRALTMRRQDA
jgi:phytoene/squalene synthetase